MGRQSVAGEASEQRGEREVVLRVERVSKTFPGTRALDDVSLDVRRGEVHALIGNNGSGKSTLIKILAGVCSADRGEIAIGARKFSAMRFSAADARSSGLHFVHQVPVLFPALTVAENLAIGRGFELGRPWRIRWRDQQERARRLLERFHIRAEPEMPVAALGPVEQTLIAIARALQDQESEREGVLVLDEPSAALPGPEVDRLLETLQRYAATGRSIVYVTHRLEEVLRASDRVTALRDGRLVGTEETSTMDEAKLVSFMLGRSTPAAGRIVAEKAPSSSDAAVGGPDGFLSVRGLAGGRVASVTFDLARGQVVGIAGRLGSGAAELLQMLFGALPATAGEVILDGAPLRSATPRAAVARGVAYVPADRAVNASFHSMSVRANWSAAGVSRYFRRWRLRHAVERAEALAAIERFSVRAASDEQPFSTLSGGNQQKVVLARWLHELPKLLLLDEPTQGVDVHARAEIHHALRETARRGTLAIVVGSDFQELARLCDRVLVMIDGRIVADLAPPSLDAHRLSELAHFSSADPS
jgi:ribose transport system ATP-binding protein